jgi:phenylalanyl-tRNA synthetase beta chain
MIISWNWLREYVQPAAEPAEVARRLTMSGLNHESTEPVGGDFAIDLEVTSNRPDCLGHLGVAREVAALFDVPVKMPEPQPAVDAAVRADGLVEIEITASDLCPLYTARVIRGIRIGPSPKWLVDRLATVGLATVNNVVDCTNYVMLECSQPLHAFDLRLLRGQRIIVRRAAAGEKIEAINHQLCDLDAGMCVIADGERPVAIAGVMGGADSEISDATTDLLLEAAVFAPQSVRSAARKLNLHSPSSFRFERGVDPAGTDWASRRCCELILQTAGGTLASSAVVAGEVRSPNAPIRLRMKRLAEVIGIAIGSEHSQVILQRLGCSVSKTGDEALTVQAPTWRADLTREIDLIEEVGRIEGYEKVPDTFSVPLVASGRTATVRALDQLRQLLTAAGFDEAMTPSLVPARWSEAWSPWTEAPPLRASQPMLGVLEKASQNVGPVEFARRSLVPSLLEARRINEHRGNHDAELFEIAHAYWPQSSGLPRQPRLLGLVSLRDFSTIKGLLERMVGQLCPGARLSVRECDDHWLDPTQACRLELDGELLGWLGRVDGDATAGFGLRSAPLIAELNFDVLLPRVVPIRRQVPVSSFPAVQRDFNFIVADAVRWSDLESTVRSAGGELVESVTYRETFRDVAKDGPGRKRVLLSVVLRSHTGTLSGSEVEASSMAIREQCHSRHEAKLVS